MTAPHAISAPRMTTLAETSLMTPPHLAGLNPRQREAVEALDGPLLVLAGAGTGKTRVLTARLIHLLATRRAWPSQILAVTFTNKAAREMRERVAAQIGPQVEGLWLGTFHSLAARILRRHAELVGLRPDYTILDTDDQIRLIKQLLEAAKIDDKKWPARIVLSVIERWKDRGLTPDKVNANEAGEVAAGRAVEFYAAYQERLRTLNACDFGDLLLHGLTLFQTRPDVLADWQKRFRYLLVDEYQDTNVAQYLWLRLLAQGHRNIACVGDDDQSIYSWRGAEIANILRFEKDFPGAKIVRLEQNYRSTGHILAAASGLIAHNRGRLGKTLWTEAPKGEKIQVRGLWDGEEEARFVGEEIEALQRVGMSLGEIAVLVRAGYQTREFEERLIQLGVPYRVVGGLRFYERLEIRDAVAYLRVIAQPADDLAFERIVNTPKRGIGEATIQSVHRLARARGLSLVDAVRAIIVSDDLKSAPRNALARVIADFDRWRARLPEIGPDELARIVLDESGYTAMWQADRSAEAPGRLDNLKELVAAIADFETLGAFLEHVSLVMENTEGAPGPMVTLMTLHAAKGLEFNAVFLPGWEEGVFPNLRALEESGEAALEEERRLAYVGLTRARQRATILFAANRRTYGNWQTNLPSRFLGELPAADVEVQSMPGLWDGGGHTVETMGAAPTQARARRMPPIIEGRAERVAPRRAGGSFAAGDRVFHEKFGYGRVAGVDADKLAVDFEQTGRKNVLDAFVTKA